MPVPQSVANGTRATLLNVSRGAWLGSENVESDARQKTEMAQKNPPYPVTAPTLSWTCIHFEWIRGMSTVAAVDQVDMNGGLDVLRSPLLPKRQRG